MPPLLRFYHSTNVSDTQYNGGTMSGTEVVSGVNGIFQDVPASERISGYTTHRRLHLKVDSPDQTNFIEGFLLLDARTTGDDYVRLIGGGQHVSERELVAASAQREWGSVTLSQAAMAGDSSINIGAVGVNPIKQGDVIAIGDIAYSHIGNTSEMFTVLAVTSTGGNQYLLDLDGTLLYPRSSALGGYVTSLLPLPRLVSTSTTLEPAQGGAAAYNNHAYYPQVTNGGAIDQSWSLLSQGAGVYTLFGDTVGDLGSFSAAGGIAPINLVAGVPYFSLQEAGFTRIVPSGEYLYFTTTSAAYPFWLRRVTPMGAVAALANTVNLEVLGNYY